MLALAALMVLGCVSGAPQFPVYYNYPAYYNYYYPQSHIIPQYRYVPVVYPSVGQPIVSSSVVSGVPQATTKGIFGLPDFVGFQTLSAGFVTSGTNQKMNGNAEFSTTPFTGNDLKYTIFMTDSSDGNLKVAGNKYTLYIESSCSGKTTKFGEANAPSNLINGFYLKGTTGAFNLDGSNGKTTVRGKYLVVYNSAGTVVGCTGSIS